MHLVRSVLILPFLCVSTQAIGQEALVQPYLQNASPTSIWILWETTEGDESRVSWGSSSTLSETATGTVKSTLIDSRLHSVELDNLMPSTHYQYRVHTGSYQSEIVEFTTPPTRDSEAPVRLVAMSDMQRDSSYPNTYEELVNDGVIEFLSTESGQDIHDALGLVLIPGDLVDNGWNYSEWRTTFFEPGQSLMARVPFYPVPGNHEANSPYFFDYFNLPDGSGTEHWWSLDYSHVRIIGLDSNSGFRTTEQLDYLASVLDDSCTDPLVDFVFAQLHHPHKSELWIDGEIDYTGEVLRLLETFSTTCLKATIHFFGHTHGYSRRQSRDHSHLWVNVASAGGSLDNWGEYAQRDYDEFSVSRDEYGFVVIDTTAGDHPDMHLRRITRGTPFEPKDNVVQDEVLLRLDNLAPATPEPLSPRGEGVSPRCTTVIASAYSDPDSDLFGSSHWQLSSCDGFESPIRERWIQHENWYFNEDTRAGLPLTEVDIGPLEPSTTYCWRVRYRDQGLVWSAWSESASFTTSDQDQSPNLLSNPNAEMGTNDWEVVEGVFEAIEAGECDGIAPYEGHRLFVVGGVCESSDTATVRQNIAVGDYREAISSGLTRATYGGHLSTYSGADHPQIALVFRDGNGDEISRAGPIGTLENTWTAVAETVSVPENTEHLEFILTGTRHEGVDNDSYMDALTLILDWSTEESTSECGESPEDPNPSDPGDGSDANGCGCSTPSLTPFQLGIGGAALLLSAFRRRRYPASPRNEPSSCSGGFSIADSERG